MRVRGISVCLSGVCVLLSATAVRAQIDLAKILPTRSQPCAYMHEGSPTWTGVVCADYAGDADRTLTLKQPVSRLVGRVPTPGVFKRVDADGLVTYGVRMLYDPTTDPSSNLPKPEVGLNHEYKLLFLIQYDGSRLTFVRHSIDRGLMASGVYPSAGNSITRRTVALLVDGHAFKERDLFMVSIAFKAKGLLHSRVSGNEISEGAVDDFIREADVLGTVQVIPREAKLEWYLPSGSESLVGSFVELKVQQVIDALMSRLFGEIVGEPGIVSAIGTLAETFFKMQQVELPPLFVASSATKTSAIRGQVSNTANAGVGGAVVTAVNLATGKKYRANTDAAGNYQLGKVTPGSYSVRAERVGFAPSSVAHVTAEPGMEVEHRIRLSSYTKADAEQGKRVADERAAEASPGPKASEVLGPLLLGVLEGIAAARGVPTPPVPPPAAPLPPGADVVGSSGQCGMLLNLTIVSTAGERFYRRIIGPAAFPGWSATDFSQFLSSPDQMRSYFLNLGRYRWGLDERPDLTVIPPMPGVSPEWWKYFMNELTIWGQQLESAHPQGEPLRQEWQDECGRRFVIPIQ